MRSIYKQAQRTVLLDTFLSVPIIRHVRGVQAVNYAGRIMSAWIPKSNQNLTYRRLVGSIYKYLSMLVTRMLSGVE